jgi:predicted Zn-dependent protease
MHRLMNFIFNDSYAPCVLSPKLTQKLMNEITGVNHSIINFSILPGDDTLPEMIKSINDGFYLINGDYCESSEEGEYACRISCGYHIENGKLGLPITDCVIWGFSKDFLQTITKVGNDFEGYAPSIKVLVNIGHDPTKSQLKQNQ